eukprot:Seg3982.1 transcript_id=Seg3982.1/GoldUCD/mRNA.D3Y31 product="hypothetical protein" protein_id=Seg3982.1/GoldUCD/D3Y31
MQSQQLFLSSEQNLTELASAQAAVNYSLSQGLQANGDQLVNNTNDNNSNQILNQNGQALPPGYYFVPFASQQAYASHQSAYIYDTNEGDSNSTYEYLLKQQQQQLATNYPLYVVQDPATGLQHVFCAYDYSYSNNEQLNSNFEDMQLDNSQLFESKSDSEQDSSSYLLKSETSSNDSNAVTDESNCSEIDSTSPIDSPNNSQFNSSNDDSQCLTGIEPDSATDLACQKYGLQPPCQIQEVEPSAHASTEDDFPVVLPNSSSPKTNLHDLSFLGLECVQPHSSGPISATHESGSALECLKQRECSIDSEIKDKKISKVLASFAQFVPQNAQSALNSVEQGKDSAESGPKDVKISQFIPQNAQNALESLEHSEDSTESRPKDIRVSPVLASQNVNDGLECLEQIESAESGPKDTKLPHVPASFSQSISQNANEALESLEQRDGTVELESEDTNLSQVLGSFSCVAPSKENDYNAMSDDEIDFITANNFESREDETNDYLENYVECLVSLEENLNRQTSFNESSIDEIDRYSVEDGSETDIDKSLSDLFGPSEETVDDTQCNRVVIKDGLVYQVKSQDLAIQSHPNHANQDIFDVLLGCSDDNDCDPGDSHEEQQPRFENDNFNRKRDYDRMEADETNTNVAIDSEEGNTENPSLSDQSLYFTQDVDNVLSAGTIKRQRLSSLSLESCICASNEAYIEKSTFEDYLRFTDSVEYLGNIKQETSETTEHTEFVIVE